MQLRKLAVAVTVIIAFPAGAIAADAEARVHLAQQETAPAPDSGGASGTTKKDDGDASKKHDGDTSEAKKLDVKSTFRNICGFCHEDYGRKQGKGPQLMDNPNTDEFLFNRVKNGKPGRMAAFGSVFSDDQIRDIVKFIRELKPGVQP